MSLQFLQSLNSWAPQKDHVNWVLGVVTRTKGSVYRKAGALMLLSEAGDQLGILSGGCLESDLMLQARKVISLGKSISVTYDSEDEGSLAWRLGIGCGGAAEITLLPCNSANDYLGLRKSYEQLKQGYSIKMALNIGSHEGHVSVIKRRFKPEPAEINGQKLSLTINPPPHLAVFGGGIDMQSLCLLASNMGWQVSVIDHRPANARAEHFRDPIERIALKPAQIKDDSRARFDAAIIASHSLATDAEALSEMLKSTEQLRYLGLLGPSKRRSEVFELAGIQEASIPIAVAGPMGLALGGDLPEDVALAVLAECHAVLYGSTAKPMSTAYL
jgi:xanthine dehydrogenase accessory factor